MERAPIISLSLSRSIIILLLEVASTTAADINAISSWRYRSRCYYAIYYCLRILIGVHRLNNRAAVNEIEIKAHLEIILGYHPQIAKGGNFDSLSLSLALSQTI